MNTQITCSDRGLDPGCDSASGGTSSSGGAGAGGTLAGGSGGTGASGGTGGISTGGVTSACVPACTGSKPVCNELAKTCVECTSDAQCSGAKSKCKTADTSDAGTGMNTCVECTTNEQCSGTRPLCDSSTNTCAECLSNSDCPEAAVSLCSAGTCSPCAVNAHCAHIGDKSVCKIASGGDAGLETGMCVQCTVSDEAPCGGKSCNPATSACTTTVKGSRKTCYSCQADSECGTTMGAVDPNSRCVPMTFNGAAHGTGGYCLQTVSSTGTSGCTAPYTTSIKTVSLSGAASTGYCGINESATTCEALLDLFNAKSCTLDTDCGSGLGGLCNTVGTNPNRCTIPCDSAAQCLASAPGNSCSNTTNGWCQ